LAGSRSKRHPPERISPISARSGEEATLALFGSILEHRGRFKLFSFNIDR